MNKVLKLVEVRKVFGLEQSKVEALKQANLEIVKGEIVALVGPSGSGKTTLLQIAGLLDSSTSGQVILGEIDTTNCNDEKRTELRKNHIGFIYQFHHLLPEFSAIENVTLPLLIRGENKKSATEKAQKILAEVGLSDRLLHKSSELSGGQQQRVAIARAVVGKPSLILADEPTGNLDSELSGKIFLLLQNLVRSYQIGCLMVTHNVELAKKADRIISIKDGVIES